VSGDGIPSSGDPARSNTTLWIVIGGAAALVCVLSICALAALMLVGMPLLGPQIYTLF
jgi:hypothetical protein